MSAELDERDKGLVGDGVGSDTQRRRHGGRGGNPEADEGATALTLSGD